MKRASLLILILTMWAMPATAGWEVFADNGAYIGRPEAPEIVAGSIFVDAGYWGFRTHLEIDTTTLMILGDVDFSYETSNCSGQGYVRNAIGRTYPGVPYMVRHLGSWYEASEPTVSININSIRTASGSCIQDALGSAFSPAAILLIDQPPWTEPVNFQLYPVPEPDQSSMLIPGLVALSAMRRKRYSDG